MTARILVAVLLIPLLTAGCSTISVLGEASQSLEIYELQTPEIRKATSRRNIELVVEEPMASGALATDRIMVRPAEFQAQYLPEVRWADTAPVMMQTLLVRSLTETRALRSVGRRPVGTIGDFAVLSELTDFQAETSTGMTGATIRVRLMLRVVRERDATVVATQTFSVTENSASTEAEEIVAAFDRATSKLLTVSVPWIVSNAR